MRQIARESALMSTDAPDWPGFRCDSNPVDRWSAILTSRTLAGPASRGRFQRQSHPLTIMTPKIEISFNRIARLADAADLAEMLFPGNRNQQHCFLVIWFSLKWAGRGLVPNLHAIGEQHGVSRRTLERVRAKLRRLGLIDHVSRFDRSYGYRECWILSARFERSLRQLEDKMAAIMESNVASRENETMLLKFADARRSAARKSASGERTEVM